MYGLRFIESEVLAVFTLLSFAPDMLTAQLQQNK